MASKAIRASSSRPSISRSPPSINRAESLGGLLVEPSEQPRPGLIESLLPDRRADRVQVFRYRVTPTHDRPSRQHDLQRLPTRSVSSPRFGTIEALGPGRSAGRGDSSKPPSGKGRRGPSGRGVTDPRPDRKSHPAKMIQARTHGSRRGRRPEKMPGKRSRSLRWKLE